MNDIDKLKELQDWIFTEGGCRIGERGEVIVPSVFPVRKFLVKISELRKME
jgi:hypothetical protein